jgi:hypothetical protein
MMKTAAGIVFAAAATACLALPASTTRFDDGAEGWEGPQGIGGVGTFIDEKEGDPVPGFHTVFNDFGITFRNSTNENFVQDLTQVVGFSFSIDTKVNDISFFGTPAPRPWLVEFRDFDAGPSGNQFASVWYKFADISAATHGEWTRFSVDVLEKDYGSLPAGWRGAGAEDPVTFEPMLPEGITFADVIAGYDELAITTLEPGFFFGFTDHDVVVDNITLATDTQIAGCNPSDIVQPFGVLDLSDIQCFIEGFLSEDPISDFAAPFGVFDLADLASFINSFVNGCP